jgi:hypothetical protein
MLPLLRGKERTAKTRTFVCSQKKVSDFIYSDLNAKSDKKTLNIALESTPRTMARGKV